ncbi:putative serine protease K12H4.7 isoform X1 [Agrilus planipennis]|uniref:Serine protease K12H4.7 isoform X1 n=1 Tax=Agrilus planipennis TaxID=224129 RepID=A0A7F5QVU1_AGRPL|nr:putative serine protease K12H4.7 isoform X1 [Agrilus planipennis]
MWVFFGSLFLLTTGTFSVEGEISFMRHGIPPARETDETRASSPEWGTISQRVDHFNPADNRMWDMVVVAGSSYAGSLAAWARIKYPHKIDIAYSSSGPLHTKADFPEYFAAVEESLRLASPTCPQLIRRAMADAMKMLETREGAATLSELFNTCEPLKGPVEPDRSYFLTSLSSPFADVVQTADPGDLVAECERLENNTGSDLEKLAKYIKPLQYCIWTYDLFKEYYSETHAIGVRMRSK